MKDHMIRVRVMAQRPPLFLVDQINLWPGGDPIGLLALSKQECMDAIAALTAAIAEPASPKCVYVVSDGGKVTVDRG